MKFEDVLPFYKEGRTVSIPTGSTSSRALYNKSRKALEGIREFQIMSDAWQIEPEKCTRCDGTGEEPIARMCHLTNCFLEKDHKGPCLEAKLTWNKCGRDVCTGIQTTIDHGSKLTWNKCILPNGHVGTCQA